jgi:hypothetical protein
MNVKTTPKIAIVQLQKIRLNEAHRLSQKSARQCITEQSRPFAEKSRSLTTEKRWLRIREAAKYLDRTEGAVRNLLYRGYLTKHRFQGIVYLDRVQIDRMLEHSSEVFNGN